MASSIKHSQRAGLSLQDLALASRTKEQKFHPLAHLAWGAGIGLSLSLALLIGMNSAVGADVGNDSTRYNVALILAASISSFCSIGFTLGGFLIVACGNGAVACGVSTPARRSSMQNQKQSDAKKLERELKQTFPASDPLSSTQPVKKSAGAPSDRTSVNSGAERKLAEEIELNDTKKEQP